MSMVTPASMLPSLFIASSTEGLPVAFDVQEALEYDCHATVWSQGVFEAGHTVMQDLVASLPKHDLALFVFTPDDAATIRGQSWALVRDNVVFELGLFIGALGLDHCFYLLPRGFTNLRLPSDLSGLLPLDYPINRPDGNRLAALGPACNKLRRQIRRLFTRQAHSPRGADIGSVNASFSACAIPSSRLLEHYLSVWKHPDMETHRTRLRSGIVLDHALAAEDGSLTTLSKVYHFLNSMAGGVLDGVLDEGQARLHFESAVLSVWPLASRLLAPPSAAGEFWVPLPSLAHLHIRWQ